MKKTEDYLKHAKECRGLAEHGERRAARSALKNGRDMGSARRRAQSPQPAHTGGGRSIVGEKDERITLTHVAAPLATRAASPDPRTRPHREQRLSSRGRAVPVTTEPQDSHSLHQRRPYFQ